MLKFNVSKYRSMIYHKSKRLMNEDSVITQYEVVNGYKYLGHWLTHNICDNKDVQKRLDTFY